MNKIILVCCVCLLSLPILAEGIEAEIKETVSDNWDHISEWCDEVVELRKKLPSLPEQSFWRRDQRNQRKDIHEVQAKIRNLLLSSDARKVMCKIEEIDDELSRVKAKQEELREEKAFYPKRQEKIDKKLAVLNEDIRALEDKRAKEVDKVRCELETIGLKFQGKSIDHFISLINRKDFVDNIIVARAVCDIVENLRSAMSSGNVVSATRYYGIYVVLMDVQISCYEAYLEKSRHGEWQQRLNALEAKTQGTIEKWQTNIVSGVYEESDRKEFERLVSVNKKLLTGISVYRKLLGCYEDRIEERLTKVKQRRERAQCAFETSANVLSFTTLAFETQSDYSALMELDLPELKEFSDEALDEQIRAITLKLDM